MAVEQINAKAPGAPGRDRRASIIDHAQTLFFAFGYDRTTVSDVIARARVSKGGFYHHFPAKEDLLDAVVERLTHSALAVATAELSAGGGDALARFNRFLSGLDQWRLRSGPELRFLTETISVSGNALLYQRIHEASARIVMPLLTQLIDDGVAEGQFDVTDSALAAEIFIGLTGGRREIAVKSLGLAETGDTEAGAELLSARLAGESALMDRVLGLPPGSLAVMTRDDCRELLHRMTRPQ